MALIPSPNKHDKEKEYQKLKNRMENMDIVRYTLSIPVHIHEKVRHKLISEKKNMKELIMKTLIEYIDDDNK